MMISMKTNLPVAKAEIIAREFGDQEFIQAIDNAKKMGLANVDILTTEYGGEGEIAVQRPRTIMVAWKPRRWERERISVPEGTECEDIHMTFVYLGDIDSFTPEQQRLIVGVVTEVAQSRRQIEGQINTFGRFTTPNSDGMTPLWVSGDFPGLRELHDDLVTALKDAGITWEEKFPDWRPHITVGYIEEDDAMPMVSVKPYTTIVDNLTVYVGGIEYRIDLDGPAWGPTDDDGPYFDGEYEGTLYQPVLKDARQPVLNDEKRYTYGPWYVPDSIDLHKEWATRDTVQEALWKYVDSGDRDIRLQHNTDIVAGRWVELATFPFPVSIPVVDEAGVLQKHTYPAGTPFMGTIWEPWAWELVKADKIRGYSIGGTAKRIEVDMPGPPEA